MTIRRVQGFNVPYTYPDHDNVKTPSDSDQSTAQKTPENPPNKPSEKFKGEIDTIEPYVKKSKKE